MLLLLLGIVLYERSKVFVCFFSTESQTIHVIFILAWFLPNNIYSLILSFSHDLVCTIVFRDVKLNIKLIIGSSNISA